MVKNYSAHFLHLSLHIVFGDQIFICVFLMLVCLVHEVVI